MRLAAQAKGGFYPTPHRVAEAIAGKLYPSFSRDSSNEVIRLLDPCCGTGQPLHTIARHLSTPRHPNIETYGIELNTERAEQSSEVLTSVLNASVFNAALANRAFNVLFLNPPYDNEATEVERTEHKFLTATTRYLLDDGLLIYIIPETRLERSAKYLANNYRNIDVYRFPDPEYDVFKQCVLLGRKKMTPLYSKHDANTIDRFVNRPTPTSTPAITEAAYQSHNIYPSPQHDILFSIRNVDPIAAAEEAQERGLWQDPTLHDLLWPEQIKHARPLMPLRKGHLAMLMAAGFLDNMELTNGEDRLLVKGRVEKQYHLTYEDQEKVVHRERMKTVITTLNLNTGELEQITEKEPTE